ncbi:MULTISPECIES: hypothetical protein [unclassified Aureispira]|uniref:DUF7793 family protein n=1 Tax=unclassified Aureispira TaxID=2649989 RepID=UPI0006979683|nr:MULTISPECIES: hypothetical protein [unclassified Aureispira]WMX12155.1 hypothetical protein QP953_15115 [Aureispira sp. CCB-E]
MRYKTKEITIISYPNAILEISINKEVQGVLTLEEVENNLNTLHKAANGNTVATLIHVSNTYIKKEVLRHYADVEFIVATVLLVNSYPSKLIGNIFLSIVSRFNTRQVPTKLFTSKEKGIQWLEKQLALLK